MRIKLLFATTMVVAVFLSSCKRNFVALDFTSAKGEIPQLGNLIFRFNKSLAPDSLVNNWDSTEYVKFEPSIPGRFRWEAPDQLVFSPSQPLAPATTYHADITNEVLRYSKYNTVKDKENVSFHTAPLQLTDAQVTWVLRTESGANAVPQVSVAFNYPVNPADLLEKMHLQVEGNDTRFELQTASASSNIVFILNDFKGENKNYEAKLFIDKGLVPAGGHNHTEDKIQTLLTITSPFILNINNVESEHDGTEGIVRISTSQQLSGDDISTKIKFIPAVACKIEYTEMGVVLRSDKFNAENSYELVISKGLRGRIGGVLKEDYNGSVAFGELESDIKFTNSKAVYLSKKGGGNVEVRITNTPKVKLVISRIYENNLLMAHRYGYSPDDEGEASGRYEEEEYEGERNYINSVAGDVIYTKEIDTRSLPKSGNGRILNISQFTERLNDTKGIYHVMLRSSKDYWVNDSRFISLSDIGLIAKQGEDKIVVFANSIMSAGSMEGVTVNVFGLNNQLMGTGSTNTSGVAEIALVKRSYSGFKPAMIIAKTADDFTYLPFHNTQVNTSRFDVGGKHNNASGLDAFVYAERDIYRPGEKVNFAVLVRDVKWKSPGEIPVQLKFILPNGKEFKVFRKSLNEGGATEGSVDIPVSAITGSYVLEVYTSNGIFLSSKNFMIEEFVPDRIKVSAKLNKSWLRPGEASELSINAVNFFGPPAAGRNYEMEIQVKQKAFSAKNYPGYDFSLANQESFNDKEVKEGRTDEAGNAKETFEVPGMYANSGLLQANFYTTVFDETGRPVSKLTTTDIFTQDIFNGISDDGYYYYSLNQPVKFQLISLNKDGIVAPATARITVIRHEYKTALVRSGSYFRYDSQVEDKILVNGDLTVGNGTAYIYIPRSPGSYEVRLSRPGAHTYVAKHFYSYGSWGNTSNTFEVDNEGHVDIETDKDSYHSGDVAKILFKAPFSGRMLVTTERDGLLSYQYIDVQSRSASINLKLDASHVPNIYITATLFKPHGISDIPLTVAHGFHSLSVEEKQRKLPVTITAKTSSRSHTHQQVRVKSEPGSYVTLSAVDNGVLQVTDFKTPDPYNYYYQKKALEVNAYDMYPLLFPELRTGLSSTGGDGESDMSKRNNPMPAKRIKILSYWSGIRKTDANGIAEFNFDVPQFNGQVRLMAVASKEEKFGAAESNIQVADPVVISASLPRFLSPGDTAYVPVTLSNTTSRRATGKAVLSLNGPLHVLGSSSQNVTIEPGNESRLEFRVYADPAVNTAKVLLAVEAFGEKFSDVTDISVRPASTLQKISGSGSVTGTSTTQLIIPKNDFIESSYNYELIISQSPVAALAEQLRYLVQYPYGCTEQTVSAAFPQLYYGDFSDLVNSATDRKSNANANVVEAIRKIKMRQIYNGGVTLWDGEDQAHWWATVYAAHFLVEAKKAGFDVDPSLLETMLGYLVNRLKTKETINYYYNRNANRKIAPKEVSYSLYVLALANRAQVPAMNYYKSNPHLLALDSRYMLSAAYAIAGDRKAFSSFLPKSFSGESSNQETGGSFYSETRDEAIALSSLVDVDPGNSQIPIMAKHVSDRLKSEAWLNTQERAFSFLALGKISRTAAKTNMEADIIVNGKSVAHIERNEWKGNRALLKSNQIAIKTKGSGGRMYYSWVAEGISTSGNYKEEDNYIRVRRSYFDRYGKRLTGNDFNQNELIIVAVTLENAYSNKIENVVITDLLPAGFEIENARTKELPGMDWIKNAWAPAAIDVRDDRIHFFVNAGSEKQTYYYAVRAVSTGIFRQGPVSADAMYNGAIHSYHGAGIIKIARH
jgi:alpha-2-macroglobulin